VKVTFFFCFYRGLSFSLGWLVLFCVVGVGKMAGSSGGVVHSSSLVGEGAIFVTGDYVHSLTEESLFGPWCFEVKSGGESEVCSASKPLMNSFLRF